MINNLFYLSFRVIWYLIFHLLLSSETCLKMSKLKLMSDTLLWRSWLRFFSTPSDKLDGLKTQLNTTQTTTHVFAHVPCVDLRTDKDEDMWKTIYYPQVIHNDGDVASTFRSMVEINSLYLCVCSNCDCPNCQWRFNLTLWIFKFLYILLCNMLSKTCNSALLLNFNHPHIVNVMSNWCNVIELWMIM